MNYASPIMKKLRLEEETLGSIMKNRFNPCAVLRYQTHISEFFISKNLEYFGIINVLRYRKNLSEDFIIKNINEIAIAHYKMIRTNTIIIDETAEKIGWHFLPVFRILPEEFIKKYRDKFDWKIIAMYQILSKKFIMENAKHLVRKKLKKDSFVDHEIATILHIDTHLNDELKNTEGRFIDCRVIFATSNEIDSTIN